MIQPLISVIIPVHNTKDFLDDCLRSVINQSYKNLEIIIVDDDSTDDSKSIINKFKSSDKRIKYYYTKQHNPALTRREGIQRSTAKYICFVDSDDLVSCEYVQVLYDALHGAGSKISSAKIAAFINQDSVSLEAKAIGDVEIINNLIAYFFDYYMWDTRGDYIAQSINAKLFEKSSLENIDYSRPKSSILEDNYIVPQILKQVRPQKITLANNTVYYYRQNQNSTQGAALSGLIKYGDKEVSYPELFDITMDYVRDLFKDYTDIDGRIHKLKSQVYRVIAETVVGKNIHIENIETQKKELIAANENLDKTVEEYRTKIDNIMNSKTYKVGQTVVYPAKIIKLLIKMVSRLMTAQYRSIHKLPRGTGKNEK